MKTVKVTPVTYAPTRRATVPVAWRKAAGILRSSAKRNVGEIKKMRREWKKRG